MTNATTELGGYDILLVVCNNTVSIPYGLRDIPATLCISEVRKFQSCSRSSTVTPDVATVEKDKCLQQ